MDPIHVDTRRLGSEVLETIRTVLAACHGRTVAELAERVADIRAAQPVLAELDPDQRRRVDAVCELLADHAAGLAGAVVDLADLPTLRLYAPDVQDEVASIREQIGVLTGSPAAAWWGLREQVARVRSARSARQLADAISQRRPVADLVAAFRRIEPPTVRRDRGAASAGLPTARAVWDASIAAGRTPVRLSLGYRTLDIALTGDGEPLGSIAPGEGMVIAGPTGTGKSSFSYGMVPAVTQDMCNWGLRDAKVIFAHTEEEATVKIRACRLGPGQEFHHLADNVVVAPVGSSRVRLAQIVYDCVADAVRRSAETGRPVTSFLPWVLVLDYAQALTEVGETELQATIRTAEYLLRGVQAFDPDEMAKFSGVHFRDYSGMEWPEGCEAHRIAVIAFAQLVKQDDRSLLYVPGRSALDDFVLEDDNDPPAWRGPDGTGRWCWEVRSGDLRLFKQNAIRGSGVLLQNATTIILLHRSRAYNNPAVVGPDGRSHLVDRRARLILDKTRTGSKLKYVPMVFDLQRDGFRAQYYDHNAERAIAEGRFTPDAAWMRPGDPILPPRPRRSALADVRY